MRKTVSILGAGRVGRALGRALRQRGWKIGAVVTRSPATARAAVRAIGSGTPHAQLSPAALRADVILVSTPDSAIGKVAAALAAAVGAYPRLSRAKSRDVRSAGPKGRQPGLPLHGITVLHTSGALSHAALRPLARLGASVAAMHPMQTFSRRSAPNLAGVIFGLDGDAQALRVARRIALTLGGVPVRIDARSKAVYHTAGGFAAQHVLAVVEAGTRILMRAGFTRRQATRALMNLARQTLDNIARHGPRAAWTGPVPRGDFATVAKHVAVLRGFPREYRAAYAALTLLAVRELAANPRALLRRLARIIRSK